MNLLTFTLDGDRYGLDAATVRSIERAVAITPLPRAPDVIEGVVDVRGTLAPVFDLRRRFGRRPRPLTPHEHLVIAASGGRLVAFRVDEAIDLVAVPDLGRVPGLGGRSDGEGIARLADGAIAIYDLDAFLSAAQRDQLDAALASLRDNPTAPAAS